MAFPKCGYVHTWQSFDNPEKKCPSCGMLQSSFAAVKTPDRIRTT
jgi:rubrerythrin